MPALIAVVNDDTTFLSLMADLLEGEGYRVMTLRAATSAFPELKARNPDLLILDIRMETPEAGWQLLELLALDPTTRSLPAIVCSADAPFLRAKEPRLSELGYDILEKPFDLDELLAKIAAHAPPPR